MPAHYVLVYCYAQDDTHLFFAAYCNDTDASTTHRIERSAYYAVFPKGSSEFPTFDLVDPQKGGAGAVSMRLTYASGTITGNAIAIYSKFNLSDILS